MQIQFNYSNIDASDALEQHVERVIDSDIGRFTDRLTRIEVHFADLNGQTRGGPDDKRCMLEARPRGRDPIVVETVSDSFYTAASDASGKLGRALESRLERSPHA